MFTIHVHSSPFGAVALLISLSTWLCICRWGFKYDMKDQEVVYHLVMYFVVITLLNMIFLGHLQFTCDKSMGLRHAYFIGRTVLVRDNNIEQACGVLNRIMGREGYFEQYRRTRFYEKPCQTRRRINFEKCKAIYNEDMDRKIHLVMRKNREEPFPGCY